MAKKLGLISLVLFMIIVGYPYLSYADTAYIENGEKIEGKILNKQDSELLEIKLEVEARLKEMAGREIIFIKGNTNFPDNTQLYIFFKKEAVRFSSYFMH